jgi:predicted RecB family endonuclease
MRGDWVYEENRSVFVLGDYCDLIPAFEEAVRSIDVEELKKTILNENERYVVLAVERLTPEHILRACSVEQQAIAELLPQLNLRDLCRAIQESLTPPYLFERLSTLLLERVAGGREAARYRALAEHFRRRPCRKLGCELERIVAFVLEEFGFEVCMNSERKAKHGGSVEVDVWAEYNVAGSKFVIYVSCKNTKVRKPDIENEVGRILSLLEEPTLKVIVAAKFTKPAKAAARASGIIPIEVGEKVSLENIDKAYMVYKLLRNEFELFMPEEAVLEAVLRESVWPFLCLY